MAPMESPSPPSPQNGTLARLSFAPATHTTVITTTTTTTTSFPPFLLNAPQNLRDRDPDRFPPAATPTPSAIRKICFDLGGQSAVLEEADDPQTALNEVC